MTFYGHGDRTSYGDALSFTSNTDKLKYDGTEFSKLLHINSNGDFGIGTTSPDYKLDVQGTGHFTGMLSCRSGVSYTPGLQLGTQTTYTDDNLYGIRWGGNTLMGMGLHSSTRGTF